MDLFYNFEEEAKMAIRESKKIAYRSGHKTVEAQHMLLGLISIKDSIILDFFDEFDIEKEDIEVYVYDYKNEKKYIRDVGDEDLENIDFSEETQEILYRSEDEARRLGYGLVNTEHILLAMLIEESEAKNILKNTSSLGIDEMKETILALYNREALNDGNLMNMFEVKSVSYLDKFGEDLTKKARENGMDPVIGREKEIERTIQILSRRTKNNPCMVGYPGVGKTSIIEGLAQQIVSGKVPESLRYKKIFQLNVAAMLAGTKYRGDFEDRLIKLIEEVVQKKDVILFIDEIHNIIGAGSSEGSLDAANILKPELAKGTFQTIGATTIDEYRKYIEKDLALERRFQPVKIEEPSEAESIAILNVLKVKYENYHNVKLTEEAILAAVQMSSRYITNRYLPDKAVDLMDEASARIKVKNEKMTKKIVKLEESLLGLERDFNNIDGVNSLEAFSEFKGKEDIIKKRLETEREQWNRRRKKKKIVDKNDIAEVVSTWTGIPVEEISSVEADKLLKLEEKMSRLVIGQEEAVSKLSKAMRRARAGLKDPEKPIGTFIFVGPTGVGKTYLAKTLAKVMFGDERALTRLDMSEYMEKYSVSKLIGSAPGYVGYEEGGLLTEAVKNKPYSVVLFDEIEKAHPDIFNTMLQILDEGRLTDSRGKVVDFKNTVIIMTSNAGIADRRQSIGFSTEDLTKRNKDQLTKKIQEELKKILKPEFLNRVDNTIVFNELEKEDILKIVDIMLEKLEERLDEQNIKIEVSEMLKKHLADKGFDREYGARPLEREIRDTLEDTLSEKILKNKIKKGDRVFIDVQDDDIIITKKNKIDKKITQTLS